MRSIVGEGTFCLPGGENKTTSFEIYHLPEKDKMLNTSFEKEEAGAERTEVKKSFWNIFK
ncbi:hypothetical protein [Pedobacter sp. NJ-S-72]